MKRHTKGQILIVFGILLLLTSVIWLGVVLWQDFSRGAEAVRIGALLAEQSAAVNETDNGFLPDYVLDPNMELPTQEVEGRKYVGTIELPRFEITLPVMDGWSYKNLKIAPCRYGGSPYLNNLIICAHNYNRHFGQIKNLKIDDTVIFTDVRGNAFSYHVVQLEVLNPYDTDLMKAGDWDLTLFTCTIGGATRVTVRCEADEENEVKMN